MNPSDLDPEAVTDGVHAAFDRIDPGDLTAAISEGVRAVIGDWLRATKPNPNDDTVHRHT